MDFFKDVYNYLRQLTHEMKDEYKKREKIIFSKKHCVNHKKVSET